MTHYFDVSYMTAPLAYTYGASNLATMLLKYIVRQQSSGLLSSYGQIDGLFSPSEHANYWNQWFPEVKNLGHYYSPVDIRVNEYEGMRRNLNSLSNITQKL
jgi:hypothetical protein